MALNNLEAAFEQNSVGTDISVSLISGDLSGTDASNYTLTFSNAPSSNASITSKELTISGSFTVEDKMYDNTKDAQIIENNLTLTGVNSGDSVNLINVKAEFAQPDTGKDIVVSIFSAELAGKDTSNYYLSLEGAPTSLADIIAEFTLSININGNGSVIVNGKDYNGEMTFEDGDTIHLEAKPDNNWFFSDWSGDFESSTLTDSLIIEKNIEVTATFEIITGIKDQTISETKVWPNPFNQFIKIDNIKNISRVIIVSINGRIIRTIDNPKNKIYTGNFNNGMYLIKLIDTNGQTKLFKLIKQ